MNQQVFEKKVFHLEVKLQNLLKFNKKEDQKEINKLHFDLNRMWKEISRKSRDVYFKKEYNTNEAVSESQSVPYGR